MKDQQLTALLDRRAELAFGIKEAEGERKFVDSQIKDELEARSLEALELGGHRVKMVTTTRRTLDKKALLANGVRPDIIAKCEKPSTSVSLRVTPVKADEE